MFERFTVQARGVVVRAQFEARELRHDYVGTEHLLLALLSPDGGTASTVLHDARVEAPRLRAEVNRRIGTPAKILSDDDAAALQTIGIDLDAVLTRIEESFGADALTRPCSRPRRGLLRRRPGARTRFTPRAKKVLELALREALRLHHDYIGTEHILLGLLREGRGLAAEILIGDGVDLEELRRTTLAALDQAA